VSTLEEEAARAKFETRADERPAPSEAVNTATTEVTKANEIGKTIPQSGYAE
jgi:hypothetical protein